MPALFDFLYREYCRARLAEMRKQLLLWPGSHEVPEANFDTGDRDDTAGKTSAPITPRPGWPRA